MQQKTESPKPEALRPLRQEEREKQDTWCSEPHQIKQLARKFAYRKHHNPKPAYESPELRRPSISKATEYEASSGQSGTGHQTKVFESSGSHKGVTTRLYLCLLTPAHFRCPLGLERRHKELAAVLRGVKASEWNKAI